MAKAKPTAPAAPRKPSKKKAKGTAAPKKGRPPGPAADGRTWAHSMDELGAMLAPPRDRKIIQRGMKREGCPGRTADGRYDVAKWQEFIAVNFDTLAKTPLKLELEEERLQLQNEQSRLDLEEKRGRMVSLDDAVQLIGSIIGDVSQALRDSEETLSTKLLGIEESGELKKRLRDAHREVLGKLALPKGAKKKAFWKNVSEQLSALLST